MVYKTERPVVIGVAYRDGQRRELLAHTPQRVATMGAASDRLKVALSALQDVAASHSAPGPLHDELIKAITATHMAIAEARKGCASEKIGRRKP